MFANVRTTKIGRSTQPILNYIKSKLPFCISFPAYFFGSNRIMKLVWNKPTTKHIWVHIFKSVSQGKMPSLRPVTSDQPDWTKGKFPARYFWLYCWFISFRKSLMMAFSFSNWCSRSFQQGIIKIMAIFSCHEVIYLGNYPGPLLICQATVCTFLRMGRNVSIKTWLSLM